MTKASNQKLYEIQKSDALDRDEYFGSMKDTYNALYPSDRYPINNGQSSVKPAMFGLRSPNVESGAEPPPRINRANKPNRFKSAHERLFGRSESNDIDNTPDYINTTIPAQPLTPAPNSNPTSNGIKPCGQW